MADTNPASGTPYANKYTEDRTDVEEPLLGNGHGEADGAGAHGERKDQKLCHWLQTTATLLTLQLGWGLWLFPADFARLGWGAALGAVVFLSSSTIYSGWMFSRLHEAVPGAVLFGDIGHKAYGAAGRVIVYVIIYSLDATRCIILHLAASQSLQHAFPEDARPPLWQCGIGVAIIATALTQIRALSELSWLFLVGTFSQLVAVGIVVVSLLKSPSPDAGPRVVRPIDNWEDLVPSAVAVMNMIFAFGGQFAFMEIITHMQQPRHFPRAVTICTIIMAFLYGALGFIGYWSKGEGVADIIIFSIGSGLWGRVAAGLILLQAIAQYLVNLNIWNHNLLTLISRGCGWDQRISCAVDHNPYWWFGVSVFVVAYSCAISSSLPFFSTLVGILTSVTYLTCAYTIPAFFLLKLLGPKLGFGEKSVLYLMIPVSVVISLIGFVSSIYTLVNNIAGSEGWGAFFEFWAVLTPAS